MFRMKNEKVEVLLVHPGGPYFRKKDEGAWTIPKGEIGPAEDLLERAKIEFGEELGISVEEAARTNAVKDRGGSTDWINLGEVKQKGGKRVQAWAFAGDLPPDFTPVSNSFEMEWPPRSGRTQPFPEIDRASFFSLELARGKINPAQIAFLDRLVEALPAGATEGVP